MLNGTMNPKLCMRQHQQNVLNLVHKPNVKAALQRQEHAYPHVLKILSDPTVHLVTLCVVTVLEQLRMTVFIVQEIIQHPKLNILKLLETALVKMDFFIIM